MLTAYTNYDADANSPNVGADADSLHHYNETAEADSLHQLGYRCLQSILM